MRLPKLAVAAAVIASVLVATAPATAALASWLQLPTANLGATQAWEFTAVSCPSPTTCMAVGLRTSPSEKLISETRGPSGWTVRPVPQEPGAGSELFAVWCTRASNCVAVGKSPSGSGSVPLAEQWNGSKWVIKHAPAPAGAMFSELSSVSCPSATRCLAVGVARHGSRQAPLAELWNGSRWKITSTPKPAGQPVSSLSGISCPSTTRCFAVGRSAQGSVQRTLGEVWNGTNWAIVKTPNPVRNDRLNAVSCQSVTSCLAVGSGLAERWNGKSWSALTIAKPRGTAADLSGVSCTKTGPCYAVGTNQIQGVVNSVAELWNGSRWSVQPVPITTSFDSSVLSSVSCSTATNCTAAGSYHDPAHGDRALAEDFSIRWQDVSPKPFSGAQVTVLIGVSCTSPNACLAVGEFTTTTGSESFSQSWGGRDWTERPLTNAQAVTVANVACVTAADCTVVGEVMTGPGGRPLAEHWNGTGWTVRRTQTPAGSSESLFTSVSCPSSTSCFAVGLARTMSDQQTLAERWNGQTWRVTPTPKLTGKQNVVLGSVSCPSASSCLAVGNFDGGTFALAWNGKTWKRTGAVPNPGGATHSALFGVSCSSATNCMAVGATDHLARVPLAERWDGKKWSPLKIPPGPDGTTTSSLTGVSCSSNSACAAVGTYSVVAVTNGLAETWTGRRWVVHPIDIPLGSKATVLNKVSCGSSISCLAVGSFNDTPSTAQMLAEEDS